MRSWLDWLCGKAARRQGYKNGYRSGLRTGKAESDAIIREARQTALEHFELAVRKAREERSKILEEATADSARIRTEANNKGYDQGYKKGRREGQDSGREEAKLVAYQEAARELGIYVPEHVSEVPDPEDLSDHRLDLNAVLPNIYNTGRGWTVRVQTAEDRVNTFTFSYKTKIERRQRRSRYDVVSVHIPDEQDCLRTLFEAIKFRNRLADTSRQHATLYSECMQHVGRNGSGTSAEDFHRDVAVEFHRRLQETEATIDHVGWVGLDPEDHLEIDDAHLMIQPWTVLFNNPSARIKNAFKAVGLGEPDGYPPVRTVRDLLLITGDEFLAVNDFGPVSLNRLREGLREHGLSLWGEEPPPPPPPERMPGGREFRAIDID